MGVIGAGQLGQMLGFAGRALQLDFVFLDPAVNPPAQVAGAVLTRAFDDQGALAEMVERCDVVTFEFENVPVAAIESIANAVPVYPSATALHHAQDRLREKQLFEQLRIPLPAYFPVDSLEDLQHASQSLGFPFVLKTRRFGYDGKGQVIVGNAKQQHDAWQRLGEYPLLAEAYIAFNREVSAIGARRPGGDVAIYPLTENVHASGILRHSVAPVIEPKLTAMAERYLRDLLTHLEYVGVLALELFVVDDRLLANEFAPRVHNSGHWTIEGANTSQFENHLRAILDLPLGDTAAKGYAAMVNLIGVMPDDTEALAVAGFSLHDYGKEPRPARKLGHMTTVAAAAADRDQRLAMALRQLYA
ncbi:MAG: 5-(carboxyamino)imidazole ribonucleotide synthase [Woeseia sp.]